MTQIVTSLSAFHHAIQVGPGLARLRTIRCEAGASADRLIMRQKENAV